MGRRVSRDAGLETGQAWGREPRGRGCRGTGREAFQSRMKPRIPRRCVCKDTPAVGIWLRSSVPEGVQVRNGSWKRDEIRPPGVCVAARARSPATLKSLLPGPQPRQHWPRQTRRRPLGAHRRVWQMSWSGSRGRRVTRGTERDPQGAECTVLNSHAHKVSKVRAPGGGSKIPGTWDGVPWSVALRGLTPPGAPAPVPVKG